MTIDSNHGAAPKPPAAPQDPQVHFDRALKIMEDANMLATTKTWTRGRQAAFLAKIAEGATVKEAAAEVGVVERTAYSFRRRLAGASFDLGWRAGRMLARDRLDEEIYHRCIEGQIVTTETVVETPDGERTQTVTRRLHDNRLAMAMLRRLDRLAEDRTVPGSYVAGLIAMDYDAYLAHVATGAPIEPLIRALAREAEETRKSNPAEPLRNQADPEDEDDEDLEPDGA
ncbi:hypothetical protein SPAN111604_00265 [Sphingomonas antarctica]|uniref:hypothetical protein n=1 Tax=Sphingomonas antarctica TaxID=2040274 RepID=UPI0039EBCFCD